MLVNIGTERINMVLAGLAQGQVCKSPISSKKTFTKA